MLRHLKERDKEQEEGNQSILSNFPFTASSSVNIRLQSSLLYALDMIDGNQWKKERMM